MRRRKRKVRRRKKMKKRRKMMKKRSDLVIVYLFWGREGEGE